MRNCLESIGKLHVPPGVEIREVVCDNDPGQSAAGVVRHAAGCHPVRYVPEPVRGVVAVRNRLIEVALQEGADWLVFFDDDCEPDPDWLVAAMGAMARCGADVAVGPVRHRLPPERPHSCVRWAYEAKNIGLGGRAEGLTDMYVPAAAVMFHARYVQPPHSLRFDMAYGAMGGEDGDFFARLRRAGARVVWTDKAVAVETLPPHRLDAADYMRRCFAEGVRAYFLERRQCPGSGTALRYAVKGILRFADGLGCAAGGMFSARCRCRAIKHVSRAAGYLAGPLGMRSRYYLTQ